MGGRKNVILSENSSKDVGDGNVGDGSDYRDGLEMDEPVTHTSRNIYVNVVSTTLVFTFFFVGRTPLRRTACHRVLSGQQISRGVS